MQYPLTKSIYAMGDTARYTVIDLSGGVDAESYPVTTLFAVPEGGWRDEYKTTKLVLRRIEAGTFMMGSPEDELGKCDDVEDDSNEDDSSEDDEDDEDDDCEDGDSEDLHEVTLTKPYYIGVFEVTQKQWSLVMGSCPSLPYYMGDTRPVETLSYHDVRGENLGAQWPASSAVDATSFMGKLRAKTGIDFDLPTEAQWEYACRAGTTTALNSGKDLTNTFTACSNMDEVGRYCRGTADVMTHVEVGSYLPNAWGLYDMHGNVSELCLDWWTDSLGTTAVTDPVGATSGSGRIIRGGCWCSYALLCRSASQGFVEPSFIGLGFVGLRVAITPLGRQPPIRLKPNWSPSGDGLSVSSYIGSLITQHL